jgi:hypothetical protein
VDNIGDLCFDWLKCLKLTCRIKQVLFPMSVIIIHVRISPYYRHDITEIVLKVALNTITIVIRTNRVYGGMVMVFSATFNTISVISWR